MARVLVAEDEVLIRVDIVETLEDGGPPGRRAGDGEQGAWPASPVRHGGHGREEPRSTGLPRPARSPAEGYRV